MTERLFRSMTPDRDSRRITMSDPDVSLRWPPGELCRRCMSVYFAGDWPWCRGNPEDHRR